MEYLKSLWTDHPIRVKISIQWIDGFATKSDKMDGTSQEDVIFWSSYKGQIIQVYKVDDSIRDGRNTWNPCGRFIPKGWKYPTNEWTDLLWSPIKWMVPPWRMRCSVVHEKDKSPFKSIKMDKPICDEWNTWNPFGRIILGGWNTQGQIIIKIIPERTEQKG